jgi:hypothetical protein
MNEHWRPYREGDVEFVAPEGMARAEGTLDSPTSEYTGPGMTITFDRGPYADPLTRYGSRPGYEEWTGLAGDRPARIVTFEADDGSRVVAARLEDPDRAAGRALTAVVYLSPEIDVERGRRIVDSLRLK